METERHAFPGLTELPLVVYRATVKTQGDRAADECLRLIRPQRPAALSLGV